MTATPTLSRRAWAAVAAVAVVVIAAAAVVGFTTTGTSGASGPVVGRPAPAWSGTTLDGSALSSASERGHWVILNFFATWCGPCQRETPQLQAFAAGGRARVVGVVFRDSVTAARDFVRAHHVTWALIGDGAGTVGNRYRVVGLPVSFVIDPHGRLVKQVFGGVTAAGLDAVVPAPAPPRRP
jgi:cytochrome c biogenesis protein CcmG/thiol:disulfide interchange protein DsbE